MANDPSRLRSPVHRDTTPDLAAPRLTPAAGPLPLRTRLEIIAALSLTSWGLLLVLIAIIRSR